MWCGVDDQLFLFWGGEGALLPPMCSWAFQLEGMKEEGVPHEQPGPAWVGWLRVRGV